MWLSVQAYYYLVPYGCFLIAQNLREVVEMLFEDGEPVLETEFIGTQNVVVV
ncbi:MAG: hypothetical protein PHG00_13585 [Methylococcales bacterium]|nr:hypothetical protein [Methylococcales bacterium]